MRKPLRHKPRQQDPSTRARSVRRVLAQDDNPELIAGRQKGNGPTLSHEAVISNGWQDLVFQRYLRRRRLSARRTGPTWW